jgi:archaellum component FlaC
VEEIKEMLKAAVNGQHALKAELLREISMLRKETNSGFKKVNAQFKKVDTRFDEVNNRLDKQGKQLAYLDEDAPTHDEFEDLEKRVKKIEQYHSPR